MPCTHDGEGGGGEVDGEVRSRICSNIKRVACVCMFREVRGERREQSLLNRLSAVFYLPSHLLSVAVVTAGR